MYKKIDILRLSLNTEDLHYVHTSDIVRDNVCRKSKSFVDIGMV